ncbi:MAG: TVP38/TMEM64 family protein [Saprospiraceae bacterium]|nr:TVP38/TMEM64 family protein [Saprospiraceae bacterium]
MKQTIYLIWGSMILILIGAYLVYPSLYSTASIKYWIEWCSLNIWLAYILITILRGVFLLPSTPFVLGGVFLFPHSPAFVLSISMVGVLLSACLVYYHSGGLNFSDKIMAKYPERVQQLSQRLQSRRSTMVITFWSMFPLIPTDLICYVAGLAKMPVQYMLTGVLIGELFLNYCLVYLGGALI